MSDLNSRKAKTRFPTGFRGKEMLGSKKSQQIVQSGGPKDIGTTIGNGITLDNVTLRGMGIVRVDGVINGEIQLEGHLILGESGKIVGEAHVGSAMLLGTFEGNIYVEDSLHVAAGSHVDGNVRTNRLIIDDGADFHGTCNMDKTKLDGHKIVSFIKEINSEEHAAAVN
jgi:cytoskeletal protein CcmA (bactofilin family)